MSHPARCLAIFWKWKHLQERNEPHDALLVAGSNGTTTLYRLLEDKGHESLASWLRQQEGQYDEFVVLLHKSKMSLEKLVFLKKEFENWKNLRLELFGDGKNFIYYVPTNDTGLLDEDGCMAFESSFKNKITGNIGRPLMLDANGHLQPRYFDPVWQHYRHGYKRRLYEAKVLLLRALLGKILNGTPSSIEALLAQPEQVGLAVQFKDLDSLTGEVYHNNKDLAAAWGTLRQLWQQPQQTEADLKVLQEAFAVALATLPEPIY